MRGRGGALLMEHAGVLSDRAAIEQLRHSIARDRQLFEVCRSGDTDWQPANLNVLFDWDAPLPLTGAKRFFFPSREPLLRWNGDVVEETVTTPQPFALFGLRACDIAAITHQDQFFATHAWYVRRREQALLIGLNCLGACPGSFCRDVDAGPFARAGFDLNLTPLSDGRVMVECGTGLGRKVLESAGVLVQPLDPNARTMVDAATKAAAASFPNRPFITRAIARINAPTADPAPAAPLEFGALGPSCFACTGCTNLCPTCSCFTVVDEVHDGGGERVRCWDSCLLEGFQREASGHHPAPKLGDRLYRFWSHKFSDDCAADFGRYGCVGCGRCDITCPGSIGALHVLGRLTEGAQ